jgi:GTPase Era involved in 16S rRNA processing
MVISISSEELIVTRLRETVKKSIKSATTDGGKNFIYIEAPGAVLVLKDNLATEIVEEALSSCRDTVEHIIKDILSELWGT